MKKRNEKFYSDRINFKKMCIHFEKWHGKEEAWSDDNFFLLKKIVTRSVRRRSAQKNSEVKNGREGGWRGDVLK
jgi:hypothetical protein